MLVSVPLLQTFPISCLSLCNTSYFNIGRWELSSLESSCPSLGFARCLEFLEGQCRPLWVLESWNRLVSKWVSLLVIPSQDPLYLLLKLANKLLCEARYFVIYYFALYSPLIWLTTSQVSFKTMILRTFECKVSFSPVTMTYLAWLLEVLKLNQSACSWNFST